MKSYGSPPSTFASHSNASRCCILLYIPVSPPSHSVYIGKTGQNGNAEVRRKEEASNTIIPAIWETPFHGHSTDWTVKIKDILKRYRYHWTLSGWLLYCTFTSYYMSWSRLDTIPVQFLLQTVRPIADQVKACLHIHVPRRYLLQRQPLNAVPVHCDFTICRPSTKLVHYLYHASRRIPRAVQQYKILHTSHLYCFFLIFQ